MEQKDTNKLQHHLEYFYKWEKETPNAVFLKQPYGDTWKEITFKEAGQEIRKMVTALQKRGLKKGDHIGLLSKNCYHWILADLAISMGGFISVPYYASLPKNQLQDIVTKSDLKLIFIGKLDKWGNKTDALPNDLQVIKFPHYKNHAEIPVGEDWDEVIAESSPVEGNYIPELNDLWTIIFTSGTTGSPKGVIHTYKNFAVILKNEVDYNVLGVMKIKENVFISFLPLNHVAERTAILGLALLTGGKIGFVESIDSFSKNIQDIQPTFIFTVPRLWTKFKTGILAKMSQRKLNILLKIPIVSTLVKKKIKKGLGFSRIEIILTGAALTPLHIKRWFKKLDIHLREVYGSTEGCGMVTVTPIGESSEVGVGKPVPGFEMKVVPETGEIIYKGEQVMCGYYKEEEKTAEILKDGWYYSGDKGSLDEDNNLLIIGRVKDAFKTDKGKYVIPGPIESLLSKHTFIENISVVGMTCVQPLALINLSVFGKEVSEEEVKSELTQLMDTVNQKLHKFEKVSTIVITKDTWTEENQLLTPTLKVRRNEIDNRYRDHYQGWEENAERVIWE